MERFKLIHLFLPRRNIILLYWIILVAWLLAVALGLHQHTPRVGTLWGLTLRFPGRNAQESMVNAYIEFMYHGWVMLGLPFTVLAAVRSVAKTFRSDFLLFVQFSRTSPLYLELWRIGGILLAWAIASIPFLLGAVVGIWHPGLSWNESAGAAASCIVPLLVLMVYVYLLSSLGSPAELTISTALVLCFVLEGIAVFLERALESNLWRFLPARLPYSLGYWYDPVLRTGVLFAVGVLVVRIVVSTLSKRD